MEKDIRKEWKSLKEKIKIPEVEGNRESPKFQAKGLGATLTSSRQYTSYHCTIPPVTAYSKLPFDNYTPTPTYPKRISTIPSILDTKPDIPFPRLKKESLQDFVKNSGVPTSKKESETVGINRMTFYAYSLAVFILGAVLGYNFTIQ